jgi:hypothetical protein
MTRWKIAGIMYTGFLLCLVSYLYCQKTSTPVADTSQNIQSVYDPFGPENSPDHNGRGSGGVVTPSPYENVIQTYYTRISADYDGVQFMLDCPLQISTGISWASYQTDIFGTLFKLRSTGFRRLHYDRVLENSVPRYRLSLEGSFEYSLDDRDIPVFKVRLHWESYTRSMGMAGIGVIASNWNLMLARDLPMNRLWDIETTWMQVSGGYIMPLSPKVGGVNIAICGAVDLLGLKYLVTKLNRKNFFGAKIGSIGWLVGMGWNAISLMNLSFYGGAEWSFSSGGLELESSEIVRADIGRSSMFFGMQIIGRYFNIVGGTQKEWEYIDFQKTVISEKGLRYYLGVNYYFRR